MDTVVLDTGTTSQPNVSYNKLHAEPNAGGVNERFFRKFGDAAQKWGDEPITYEFTNDPAMLHQYYRLRVDVYRRLLGGAIFDYEPDEHDKISHILVARKGKLCVGGARLTVREPDENWLLPMENEHFKLRERFPQYHLDKYRHSEVSRFAILEDFNNKEVMYEISAGLNRKAEELGVQYGFCRSPLLLARNWRKINNVLGMYHADVLWDAEVPAVHHDQDVKMYLVVLEHVNKPAEVAEPVNKELIPASSD